MCTAISYHCPNAYFGRNLDLERGYGESVVITPRRFVFPMRCGQPLSSHYAMIGMAAVADGYPLYFEATNEVGLSMAGLNFPNNAVYLPRASGRDNIASFELIPWVLGQCRTVKEARELLERMRLVDVSFSDQLPPTPLHWLISDAQCSIAVEPLAQGIKISDNAFGVLTNNPPFEFHQMNMNHYMGLTTGGVSSAFRKELALYNYSLGLGALGLPGDFSSASRFVRAVFVKEHSQAGKTEEEHVRQFFHILASVAMPRGCVWTENGYEYTRYSSCCNVESGVYYYTTYDRFGVTAVDMHAVDLQEEILYSYPLA